MARREIDGFLLAKRKRESRRDVIFQEYSILQEEYNKVMLDIQQLENNRFQLENSIVELERKLMVAKKHNETMMELLQEKDNLISDFQAKIGLKNFANY